MQMSFARSGLLCACVLCLLATAACSRTDTVMTPIQRVKASPNGSLRNPFTGQADKISQGHELFLSYSCNGCHGGTGGGGICPPLTGDVWFFGLEDDKLFRLISLGSVEMEKEGFAHLAGTGTPMPPFGEVIKTDQEVWKIIAWIRSVYKGDPKKESVWEQK